MLKFSMMRIVFLFMFFTCAMRPGIAFEIRPFSTDFCTNFPEGTRARPDLWKDCCLIHDLYFWAGGSLTDRNAADVKLRLCVEKTGATATARIMYWAVRAGSLSPIKYPDKRWGNGWEGRKIHLPLTYDEMDRINYELGQTAFIPAFIRKEFIRDLYSRLD